VASKPTISLSFPVHLLKAFLDPQTLDARGQMDEQRLVNSIFRVPHYSNFTGKGLKRSIWVNFHLLKEGCAGLRGGLRARR
jgi:hypothetical protein